MNATSEQEPFSTSELVAGCLALAVVVLIAYVGLRPSQLHDPLATTVADSAPAMGPSSPPLKRAASEELRPSGSDRVARPAQAAGPASGTDDPVNSDPSTVQAATANAPLPVSISPLPSTAATNAPTSTPPGSSPPEPGAFALDAAASSRLALDAPAPSPRPASPQSSTPPALDAPAANSATPRRVALNSHPPGSAAPAWSIPGRPTATRPVLDAPDLPDLNVPTIDPPVLDSYTAFRPGPITKPNAGLVAHPSAAAAPETLRQNGGGAIPRDRTSPNHVDVVRIQSRLRELGYFSASPTGVWGPASRSALREFRSVNGLAEDDGWDKETERHLFSAKAIPAAGTFIGDWTPENSDCPQGQDRGTLLMITPRGAKSVDGQCDFRSVKRESASIWRIGARCSAEGDSWRANITLKLAGRRLTWSSERGATAYVRCLQR